MRETIEKAKSQRFFNSPNPILFIDEIHRFSKSQQDSLLGAVEKGIVTLIGATTENPSFEVISALLSRAQVYVLQHLTKEELVSLMERALKEDEYLSEKDIEIKEHEALLIFSGGDGRKLLNVLELVCNLQKENEKLLITNELVEASIQQNLAIYDKTGEMHYDMASAFIKSMRGSDPNAAVYYLARMIEGGEDVEFIARRMIIFASEDIGLAQPECPAHGHYLPHCLSDGRLPGSTDHPFPMCSLFGYCTQKQLHLFGHKKGAAIGQGNGQPAHSAPHP